MVYRAASIQRSLRHSYIEAIGPQLSCILVDNGLLRKDEEKSVIHEFTGHFKTDLHVVKAEGRFLSGLAGVIDPQEKRRIIGHAFIECFAGRGPQDHRREVFGAGHALPRCDRKRRRDPMGRPTRSSCTTTSAACRRSLGFELIEPLRDLFKDEVRQLGLQLGLPEEIVWRHPFPGPGLAVRCLGEVTRDRLETLREADAIVVAEIKAANLVPQHVAGVRGAAAGAIGRRDG